MLYQPAHGRFYLVAGALACRLPGLPDRAVDTAGGESAFFVLRRLEEDGEYGWSTGEPPAGHVHCGHYQDSPGRGWRRLADPAVTLLRDEERFPLFPLTAQAAGARRRVFAPLLAAISIFRCREGAALLLVRLRPYRARTAPPCPPPMTPRAIFRPR